MDIQYLIQILQNKITMLNNAKGQVFASGNIDQLNAIDKDLLDTQNTFAQLCMLVDMETAAKAVNSTTAEVVASGLDVVQNIEPVIQGPSTESVINGYDVSAYATDPFYEQKILNILSQMPVFNVVEDIDLYIKSLFSDSPVTGYMINKAANQYNVNLPLMVAIMQNDSAFGTLGVGANTFNPGNIGNTGSAERSYPSWDDGVTAVAEWLSRHRVSGTIASTSAQVSISPSLSQAVLTSIAVNPTITNLTQGNNQQLVVNTLDQNGSAINGASITYISNDSTTATVNSSGLVTAVSAGTATITVQATLNNQKVTANSVVNIANSVATPVLTGVNITPASSNILTGSTQQFVATPIDHNGSSVSGAVITFTSSDKTVATVDNTGLVTAVSAGTATISVRAVFNKNTVTGNSMINVSDPVVQTVLANIIITPASSNILTGSTQQLVANALDNNGSVVNGATITFSSSKKSIATVDNTGLVTAVSAGTATISIKATLNNQTVIGNSVININDPVAEPVLTNIQINPTAANVLVGATQQINTNTLDHDGNPISGATVTFQSSDNNVATVDSSGLVTAVSAGISTISVYATLNNDNVTGNSVITVASPIIPEPIIPPETTTPDAPPVDATSPTASEITL